MTNHSIEDNAPDSKNLHRRRPDWQRNDRRKSRPWVADGSDRRSGFDRRLEANRRGQRD